MAKLLERRVRQGTGTVVRSEKIDRGHYVATCEDHGQAAEAATFTEVDVMARRSHLWCQGCKAGADPAEARQRAREEAEVSAGAGMGRRSQLCEGCGQAVAQVVLFGHLDSAEQVALGRCCHEDPATRRAVMARFSELIAARSSAWTGPSEAQRAKARRRTLKRKETA